MKKIIFIVYSLISIQPFIAFATETEARGYFEQRHFNASQRQLNFYVYNSIKDRSYSWGGANQDQLSKWNVGISYKWDDFGNYGDSIFKVKISSFTIQGKSVLKNSLLFGVSFPDVNSKFPFYFGASIGGGVFFNQLPGESVFSLDYQTYLGVRFFNIYNTMGVFIEGGLDNHFLILSSGQYDNMYLALGLSFVF